MNRSLVAVFGLLILAFSAITAVRLFSTETGRGPEDSVANARRMEVTSFWQAYHSATRHRVEGRFRKAIEQYQAALRIDPSHEESIYYLGNCWFELGDFDEAIRSYQRLVDLNPRSQRGFSQLGAAYSSLLPGATPDLGKAREAFLRSSEINQEQSGPFLELGRLALLEGRDEEALSRFRTAAGFRSPEGNFGVGLVEFRMGRYAEALRSFGEVFSMVEAEQAISGRGMAVEGDIERGDRTLSPLEAAGIKSRLLAFWSSRETEASAPLIPEAFRVESLDGPSQFSVVRQPALGRSEGRGSWADFDADGDPDLLFAGTTGLALLRNEAGLLKKTDLLSAVGPIQKAWDASWDDFDGDGDLDVYVVGSGFLGARPNFLLRNDLGRPGSQQRFSDVTAQAGLSGERSTIQAVFADYDDDGRTDLVEVGRPAAGVPGLRLYRNLGGGEFREVGAEAGLHFEGTAVSLVCSDFDSDSRTDFFILRWHRSALLYLNQGDGTFSDESFNSGVSNIIGDGFSAVGIDYNRDGFPDLLVGSFVDYAHALEFVFDPGLVARRATPTLLRNSGAARFEEATQTVGLNHCYGTFQLACEDVDRDGWTDLILANGGLEPERLEPSLLLRNDQGKGFQRWAFLPDIHTPSRSWGVSLADVDGDGRTEIFLAGIGLLALQPASR